MGRTWRLAAGLAWCTTAAALPAAPARAEDPVVVTTVDGNVVIEVEAEIVIDDDGPGQVEVEGQGVPAAPAGDAEPEAGPRKLEPLPPVPQLLEKVMQGLLEGMPVKKETLDDVMRRAAGRNRAAAAAAEAAQRKQFIRQQTQQFEQMLQPLLHVELALARRSCGGLTPEARREVFAAARDAVHDVAEQVARRQFEGGGEADHVDVRRAIHERIAAAIGPRAAADEFAAYERESRERQERRAEAARIRIVAKIDAQLGLTAAQRSAMLEALRAAWQASWVRELEDHDGVMVNDLPPAPDFADAAIAPHLDQAQRRQWRTWADAAGWNAIPRGGIDWAELNALQQAQSKPDAWWHP
ncbi:MAG: hypothetical protein ACKOSQ_08600 [Planctomycetaceae bacterium]